MSSHCLIEKRVIERDGISYLFEFIYSDINIRELLPEETKKQINEIIRKIDNYELVYFDVCVSVMVNDDTIGNDWLGGNLYNSIDNFMQDSHTIGEMMDNAKREAIEQIEHYKKNVDELQELLKN